MKSNKSGDKILLGTRKGVITLTKGKGGWKAGPLAHAGVPVTYVARDPNTGTYWAALEHGHWGPKLSRSKDGKKWEDSPQIKYPESARYIDGYETADGKPVQDFNALMQPDSAVRPKLTNASLKKIVVLSFGNRDQKGRIYAGTMPGGLFVSDDNGESFRLNEPLWNHESRGGDLSTGGGNGRTSWFGGGLVVDGQSMPAIHSVVVDPRDSRRVLIGISCAGVLETADGGRTWHGRNKGLLATFLPKPDAEWGHDPHFVAQCPADPDHIWQQNHCGIFYSSDGAKNWKMVSKEGKTAHFGFPICVDENDGKTAWVVPMISDANRTVLKGSLCVCRTQDGGKTWKELRKGLPQSNCYDVVYRHAFDLADKRLVFGTTTGNVYVSENRGESWKSLGSNFPPVYSVRFA